MENIVYLNSFILEEDGTLRKYKEVKTPIILIEHISDFKENTFWINIKNIWVLVGKIPPLNLDKKDLVLLKEDNGRWGMFRFLEEFNDLVILEDAKGERKTRVKKEILKKLKLFGKVIKVQNRI